MAFPQPHRATEGFSCNCVFIRFSACYFPSLNQSTRTWGLLHLRAGLTPHCLRFESSGRHKCELLGSVCLYISRLQARSRSSKAAGIYFGVNQSLLSWSRDTGITLHKRTVCSGPSLCWQRLAKDETMSNTINHHHGLVTLCHHSHAVWSGNLDIVQIDSTWCINIEHRRFGSQNAGSVW